MKPESTLRKNGYFNEGRTEERVSRSSPLLSRIRLYFRVKFESKMRLINRVTVDLVVGNIYQFSQNPVRCYPIRTNPLRSYLLC